MDKQSQVTRPPASTVPQYVPPPQSEILYKDELSNSDPWTSGFYFGAFIGIGLGIVLMKLFIKCVS